MMTRSSGAGGIRRQALLALGTEPAVSDSWRVLSDWGACGEDAGAPLGSVLTA